RSITDLSPRLNSFLDTAAVLANLDLHICCDTSLAHLAGALGVPVWVALPFAPDWRWLLDREDSPWYPTMRLFRQRREGDWSDVFERIAAAARQLADERASRYTMRGPK
ncbi:MAG TPA: glycosyltransferase family 9 protein, partial [Pirellulales bacterium]